MGRVKRINDVLKNKKVETIKNESVVVIRKSYPSLVDLDELTSDDTSSEIIEEDFKTIVKKRSKKVIINKKISIGCNYDNCIHNTFLRIRVYRLTYGKLLGLSIRWETPYQLNNHRKWISHPFQLLNQDDWDKNYDIYNNTKSKSNFYDFTCFVPNNSTIETLIGDLLLNDQELEDLYVYVDPMETRAKLIKVLNLLKD